MNDYLVGNTLTERAMSGFPVSIGTALALESIFPPSQPPYDPDRSIPTKVDLSLYNSFWINLTTLFRNLSSAVSKEAFLQASVEQLVETLFEEMEVIENLFKHEWGDGCEVIFFESDYNLLLRSTKLGLSFRVPSTDGQRFYQSRLIETMRWLNKHTDSIISLHDIVSPPHHESALMLTHQPYDLTAYTRFERLDLLESNTGVLKPRALWSTKYNPMSGVSFTNIPFHKKLLFVFGDRVLIKPGPLPLRKQILETAQTRNWHALTSLDKVRLDVSLDIRDPYMVAVFNSL